VTVTVQSTGGEPYPDLPVYAFDGETYTGYNGTSDENGQVEFTLPEGSCRFRADYDGVQFWSDEENHCDLPGCIETIVEIPGGMGEVEVTIYYTYDPLYRLTAADYDDGTYFHYTYDAVGNRLNEETDESTSTYTYDIANRLIDVDGVATTWDANGNLLSDGASTYTYDAANRLVSLVQGDDTYAYTYNGLGDRLSQTIKGETTNYTLDINTYLTRVLVDGTNKYIYQGFRGRHPGIESPPKLSGQEVAQVLRCQQGQFRLVLQEGLYIRVRLCPVYPGKVGEKDAAPGFLGQARF